MKAASKIAPCVITLLGCSAEQSDTASDPTGTGGSGAVASGSANTDGDGPTPAVGTSGGTTGAAPTGAGGSGTPPAGMAGASAAGAGSGGDAVVGSGGDAAGGSGGDAAGGSGAGTAAIAGAGGAEAGGSAGTSAGGGSAGIAAGGGAAGTEAAAGAGGDDEDVVDTGAADNFSFFVTSYEQLIDLAGTEDGFGGDLRYNGAATGLEGADAICQELGRRVGFGQLTWKAYLSTSTVNAIDRIGSGPWYDFTGTLVADDLTGLTSGDRQAGGCCDTGTYDELGIFHDGSEVDDHDVLTGSLTDGTYAGFSCDDWTSVTAEPANGGGGITGGAMAGHQWPAGSGMHWGSSHGVPGCGAGTIQQGGGFGDASVGGLGGYGALYCFALPE